MKIDIASQFSVTPAGRFCSDGPDSGERFREEFLVPALRLREPIQIKIDGTAGYGSSFLEEAFGGLVRNGFDKEELIRRLHIVYDDDEFCVYKDLIFTFIKEAEV